MVHWKRLKTILFVDNGLFAGVVLFSLLTFSWTCLVDWSGPVDDMPAAKRAHAEDCIAARRAFGERALAERPDCEDVLAPLSAAKAAP